MAFIFVIGQHEFQSLLEGYENVTSQCPRCGNWSAKIVRRWAWGTLCWVPIIPFSLKPWQEVYCHICNERHNLKDRPDLQQLKGTSNQQTVGVPGAPPQGWNSHNPYGQGPYQQPPHQQPPYQQPPPQGHYK